MSLKKTDTDPASKEKRALNTDETVASDQPEITADRYLKLMMRIGIPLALISVLSLWASSTLGSAGIGLLFFISAPLALAIGFAYNIRYVMLLVRKGRKQSQNKP